MLDIFSGLRLVVKRRSISIDNAIFRCHWFFTSTLLVSFSLIITARQYVGQPIECHSVNKLPESLLNSYCWVQSTFTVPQACNKQVGFDVPYPCIDNTRGREIKMFAYYQWVGIVLFIQGLLFHLPYYLWKVWENGLIRAITGGLRVAVLSDQEREKKKNIVVEYIHDHLGCHKRYALKYFLCEFICLINLLAQLWATNKFFDGQFLRYGIDVMHYSSSSISDQFGFSAATLTTDDNNNRLINNSTTLPTQNQLAAAIKKSSSFNRIQQQQQQSSAAAVTQQVDPMTYIFPRITKCTYYDFGSSGDIQKHDALCLLPLNIINEKIYIALWFWFIILALLTLLVIFYRLFAIVSENVRCKGLISRCKLSSERDIRIICRHCDVGDWFLFYMVAENLDPLIMREIVSAIANKIRAHFDLKRELGMLRDRNGDEEDSSMYKYKPSIAGLDRYRQQSALSFDENSSLISSLSRRNSSIDEVPLVKKVKKRLYNKRLWSMDSNDLRQQLLFCNGQQQPATNPELTGFPLPINGNANNSQQQQQQTIKPPVVSAPPACQMPLNSAPSSNALQRRGSLTRTISNASSSGVSTADTFVLEMQTISGSSSQLNNNNNNNRIFNENKAIGATAGHHLQHRRLSSQGSGIIQGNRHISLIRQRSLNHHPSLRELRIAHQGTNGQVDNNPEEIQILK